MTYIYYCYFNMTQVQGVLNSVVMLMGSSGVDGDYLGLLKTAASLGIFVAVGSGFVKARGEAASMYVVMMAMFYYGLFIPRVDVTIQDMATGAGAPVNVSNVPIGLAFFVSTSSHIGYWLTSKSETFFSLPDTSLNLSGHGLMGGSRALRYAQDAEIQDPILAQDMAYFMQSCVNPELLADSSLVAKIMTSTTIWADIKTSFLNEGRMVSLTGSLESTDCKSAYSILNTRLVAEGTAQTSLIAAKVSPNQSAGMANATLASLIPAAESLVYTASSSATEAIKQRMMITVLSNTSSTVGQMLNDPTSVQVAYGAAQASASANSSYLIMASLARETLPLVHNALELIVIGIFPIMLVLVVIAGSEGGFVLRSYVMTILWVQLWAPLYAIVNYVGTTAGASSLKASLGGIDGLVVNNAAAFYSTALSSEAVAGMLTLSVPVIAYALVKGGEVAMSNVASQVSAGATSSAGRAGEAVGTGNISSGNVSWGNTSTGNTNANSTNTGTRIDTSSMSMMGSDGTSHEFFQGKNGQVLQADNYKHHSSPVSGGVISQMGSAARQAAGDAITSVNSNIKSFAESSQAIATLRSGNSDDHVVNAGKSKTTGIDERGSKSDGTGVSVSNGERADQSKARAKDTTGSATLSVTEDASLGIGTPKSGGPSGSLGINGSGQQATKYADKIAAQVAAGKFQEARQTAQEAKEHLVAAHKAEEQRTGTSGSSTNSKASDSSYSKALQSLDNISQGLQKAQSFTDTAERMQSLTANGGNDVINDPSQTSAAQLGKFVDSFRNARTTEEKAEAANALARYVGGSSIGTSLPKYLDGTSPVGSKDDVARADAASKNDIGGASKVLDRKKANDRVFGAKGPVGSASVAPDTNLSQKADGIVDDAMASSKTAMGKGTGAVKEGVALGTVMTGGAGRGPLDTLSPESLVGSALAMQGRDVDLGVRQAVNVATFGNAGAQTGADYLRSAGYNQDGSKVTQVEQTKNLGADGIKINPDWSPKRPDDTRH